MHRIWSTLLTITLLSSAHSNPTNHKDQAPQKTAPAGEESGEAKKVPERIKITDKATAIKQLKTSLEQFFDHSFCSSKKFKDNSDHQAKREQANQNIASLNWKEFQDGKGLSPNDIIEAIPDLERKIYQDSVFEGCLPNLTSFGFTPEEWSSAICTRPPAQYVHRIQQGEDLARDTRLLYVIKNLGFSNGFSPDDPSRSKISSCIKEWNQWVPYKKYKDIEVNSFEGLTKSKERWGSTPSKNVLTDYMEAQLMLGDKSVEQIYRDLQKKTRINQSTSPMAPRASQRIPLVKIYQTLEADFIYLLSSRFDQGHR